MKAKNYEGFGETHGLREWARLLDVNKDTLRYWLVTKKATVEEFADKNGIKYTAKVDEGRTSVNRMAQAEELLKQLFIRSGYDASLLTLQANPGNRKIIVYYEGAKVGEYNLDKGALNMAEEGVNLIMYPVDDPKIYRDPEEGWGLHPDTRRALADRLFGSTPY